MSAADQAEFAAALASEPTPEGEQMRLTLRLAAPLTPTKPQKPLNIGLFDDDARNQLSLF